MPNTKSFFALLSILILMSALSVFSPVMAASVQSFPLQQVDQDRIDTCIQSRMQIANIPGLALGVVYGDEVVYLRGYGIAGPDGRAVTPQTPLKTVWDSSLHKTHNLESGQIPCMWKSESKAL